MPTPRRCRLFACERAFLIHPDSEYGISKVASRLFIPITQVQSAKRGPFEFADFLLNLREKSMKFQATRTSQHRNRILLFRLTERERERERERADRDAN